MKNENATLLPKRLMSIDELASYLGVSVRTIYNRTGRKSADPFPIKPKRIGRLLKWDRNEVDAYIDSL